MQSNLFHSGKSNSDEGLSTNRGQTTINQEILQMAIRLES